MKAKRPSIHLSKQLHLAIEAGDLVALMVALDAGADPNESLDGVDMNPLCKVMSGLPTIDGRKDKPAFIGKLIEHGALPGLSDAHGNTAFMRACMRGDVVSADAMMQCAQLDLLHRDKHGWAYAMAALCDMSPDFLQRMQNRFEATHWVDCPDLPRNHMWTCTDKAGRNAMMIAHDKPASLNWLLNHPHLNMAAHLEERCHDGKTVLWNATETNRIASVEILLGAGSQTRTHNFHGRQLMDHLVNHSQKHVVVCSYGTHPDDVMHRTTMKIMRAAHASQEARRAIDDLLSGKVRHAKVLQP